MEINNLSVNTIRMLSVDQVQKANSGHPGLPLGAAPMAYELWANHMRHNPKDPKWINRDRFILSAGHGSALLYSLLHLFGYGLSINDLKEFRQLESLTPGHPEYGHTIGVESTTGPLGAGISTAVGMAMSEAHMAEKFNKDNLNIIDHYTYVLCGDGDLMEGISNEACSLAGTLKLNKLIVLYDSNNITIEGRTDLAFREDVLMRYKGLGWETLEVEDGNNLEDISKAIETAKANNAPTIIKINTKIGYGSPREDMASAHGEPLGEENVSLTRKYFGIENEESFFVDKEVAKNFESINRELKKHYDNWKIVERNYIESYPEEYTKLVSQINRDINLDFMREDNFVKLGENIATRASSGKILNAISEKLDNLFGGSADLAPSNKSHMDKYENFSAENRIGKNINFGVREHAMGAIVNGINLYGGLIGYGATFLVFSDYMKPQLRLAALMKIPSIFIFTHDSIGVGEDGPTHEPIEHLAMLRSIPNFITFRPADSKECLAGWEVALKSKNTPVALALSRQNLPDLENSGFEAVKGGYILIKEKEKLDLILIATGSEVQLAVEASKELSKEGYGVRVVSMPSRELFEAQCKAYREEVLPSNCTKRITVEAATTLGWEKYTGFEGVNIGINTFGESAPGAEVFKYLDITKDRVLKESLQMLKQC